MTQVTNAVAVAATRKPVTLEVKLLNAQALVARLLEEIAAKNKAVPVKGDVVSFSFGRGDKKAELSGKVITVSAGENGVTYVSVLVNEDTLPEVKRVPLKDLVASPQSEINAALDADGAVQATVIEHNIEEYEPVGTQTAAINPADPLADHATAVAELLGE